MKSEWAICCNAAMSIANLRASARTPPVRHGARRTEARSLILRATRDASPRPLTAKEIARSLLQAGWPVGVQTVYRAAQALTGEGLLWQQRDDTGTLRWQSPPEAQDPILRVTCSRCGRSLTFVDLDLTDRLAEAARRAGFPAGGGAVSIQLTCDGEHGCAPLAGVPAAPD